MTEAYEIHGRRFGVRWTRPGVDNELRTLVDCALGVQDAPANVSVVMGEEHGATRSKHQVHVQGKLLSVVTGDGALVRTVLRALGTLATDRPPDSLSVGALLVLDAGAATAVAVDDRLSSHVRRLEPALRRRGSRVLRLTHLDVWPSRGTVALPDTAAAVGVSLKMLDARWPLQPGDDDLAAGEVALSRMICAGISESPSRLDTVAAAVPMVRDETGRVDRAAIAQLADLIGHVETHGVLHDLSRLASLLEAS